MYETTYGFMTSSTFPPHTSSHSSSPPPIELTTKTTDLTEQMNDKWYFPDYRKKKKLYLFLFS